MVLSVPAASVFRRAAARWSCASRTARARVAVGDGVEQPVMIAQRRPHRLRLHRIAGVTLVAPHRRLVRRPDDFERADQQDHRLVAAPGHDRLVEPAGIGHVARRVSNCSVWASIRPAGGAPPRSCRSSRAAHMPAQIGSRCSSASLTSPGVAARVCSTMLIMCAVRSADGRCTTAPPTLPRRTEIRPSDSRMWIASRSAGGLTPNSANSSPATAARRPPAAVRTGCRRAAGTPRSRRPAADECVALTLFRRRPFLAKLYRIVIVLPTVWLTV